MRGLAKRGHYFHLCNDRYYLFTSAENYRWFRFGHLTPVKSEERVSYDKRQLQGVMAPEAATTQQNGEQQSARVVQKNAGVDSQSPPQKPAPKADEQTGKVRISD
jgi:hypothetical protein